jgi:hypothetical protein
VLNMVVELSDLCFDLLGSFRLVPLLNYGIVTCCRYTDALFSNPDGEIGLACVLEPFKVNTHLDLSKVSATIWLRSIWGSLQKRSQSSKTFSPFNCRALRMCLVILTQKDSHSESLKLDVVYK